LSGGKAEYEKDPVRIGDCCYVGSQTVIIKGVTVGAHSAIGALSLVNKDIPSHSIARGVPAKVVGKVIRDRKGNIELCYQKES
jgi:acetyltransferase-like isoleucine patch superfamily enzyme